MIGIGIGNVDINLKNIIYVCFYIMIRILN